MHRLQLPLQLQIPLGEGTANGTAEGSKVASTERWDGESHLTSGPSSPLPLSDSKAAFLLINGKRSHLNTKEKASSSLFIWVQGRKPSLMHTWRGWNGPHVSANKQHLAAGGETHAGSFRSTNPGLEICSGHLYISFLCAFILTLIHAL